MSVVGTRCAACVGISSVNGKKDLGETAASGQRGRTIYLFIIVWFCSVPSGSGGCVTQHLVYSYTFRPLEYIAELQPPDI